MLSEEVILDRKRWIEELYSGRLKKATDALIEIEGQDIGYCVLGVGAILQYGYVDDDEHDEDDIGGRFGLDENQVDYLLTMNDGGMISKISSGRIKSIRSESAPTRDFKFMARWIEIVTALQRQSG